MVAARSADWTILPASWVYLLFGTNFVKSMLRLGRTRNRVRVVAYQFGDTSSALDIADALSAIAARLRADPSPALRGVFHITDSGEACWADLAESAFDCRSVSS
jgi:dTDP-4-dehydrorhamnose reductase